MSWKTTVCGIVAAAAQGVAANYPNTTIGQVASVVAYLATAALGFCARDNNVTSEQAGAK